jgi:hypothetical protein
MAMVVVVFMPMLVLMLTLVSMFLFVFMRMVVIVVMFRFEVNVEFRSGNAGALLARDMEVILIERQFLQFALELMEINPQIQESSDEHVAADAAENVEVNRFHSSSLAARALI